MTDLEIIQEAQERIDYKIDYFEAAKKDGHDLTKSTAQEEINSWLAHKAFFERHKRLETNVGDLCEICEYSEYRASYPCPESVAQARLILGVAND